jgi:hypothetical protein
VRRQSSSQLHHPWVHILSSTSNLIGDRESFLLKASSNQAFSQIPLAFASALSCWTLKCVPLSPHHHFESQNLDLNFNTKIQSPAKRTARKYPKGMDGSEVKENDQLYQSAPGL